jgi:hypothetical protein
MPRSWNAIRISAQRGKVKHTAFAALKPKKVRKEETRENLKMATDRIGCGVLLCLDRPRAQ